MGPKITSFKKKSRGILRTAMMKPIRRAGEDDDINDLDSFSDSDD